WARVSRPISVSYGSGLFGPCFLFARGIAASSGAIGLPACGRAGKGGRERRPAITARRAPAEFTMGDSPAAPPPLSPPDPPPNFRSDDAWLAAERARGGMIIGRQT